jgi:hypothetical protein
VDEFIEESAEVGRTLFRSDLIVTEQRVPQLGKALWCFEAVPDRGSDLIQTETFACLGIQHDQLVAHIGVPNSNSSPVAD